MKHLIYNLSPRGLTLNQNTLCGIPKEQGNQNYSIQHSRRILSKLFFYLLLTLYLGLMLHKSIFLLPFSQMVGKIEINVYFIARPSVSSALV